MHWLKYSHARLKEAGVPLPDLKLKLEEANINLRPARYKVPLIAVRDFFPKETGKEAEASEKLELILLEEDSPADYPKIKHTMDYKREIDKHYLNIKFIRGIFPLFPDKKIKRWRAYNDLYVEYKIQNERFDCFSAVGEDFVWAAPYLENAGAQEGIKRFLKTRRGKWSPIEFMDFMIKIASIAHNKISDIASSVEN